MSWEPESVAFHAPAGSKARIGKYLPRAHCGAAEL